ncbi:MAG: hypothetical protein ABIJ00_03040 [Candidatus Eisenbacteria bacterium]
MESRQIADLVRGAILLAIAVLMVVLLVRLYQALPRMGISVKQVYYFPIAIIAAVCWLAYRGVRTILAAFRNTG